MMNLRLIHTGAVLASLLAGSLAGCGASGSPPPRDADGQIRRPERPGPSQEEQRARFLEQEKKNRHGAGR